MKHLLLGSVLSAGLKVASAGLTFLMFVFLARVLGPTEYGLFASMFALGTIGSVAALFGQHTLSIKTLSAFGEGPEHGAGRRRAIGLSYGITLAGMAAFIGLLLGGGQVAAAFGFEIDMRYLIGACALALPFGLSELVSHHYRAFGAIFWALAPRDVIWRGLVVLACLGAASLPFAFTDALTAMAAVSAALMAIVAVQMAAMFTGHRSLLSGQAASSAPAEPFPWAVSAWMWLASIGTMGGSLNLSATALFLPPEQVGTYFAAQKTSQLLQLPITAINIAAAPVFARLHSQGDVDGLRDVGRKLALLISAPLALGTVVVGLLASWLLSLFDPAFAVAAPVLTLLAGSYLVIGLGGPTRELMLMSDGEQDVVRLTLISEGVGLVLIPVLVPLFGIMGAGLAACVARVLFTVTSVLWCRRRLGVDTSVFSLLPGASATR